MSSLPQASFEMATRTYSTQFDLAGLLAICIASSAVVVSRSSSGIQSRIVTFSASDIATHMLSMVFFLMKNQEIVRMFLYFLPRVHATGFLVNGFGNFLQNGRLCSAWHLFVLRVYPIGGARLFLVGLMESVSSGGGFQRG